MRLRSAIEDTLEQYHLASLAAAQLIAQVEAMLQMDTKGVGELLTKWFCFQSMPCELKNC